jgi:sulfhydrogenase subunit gamma (sulfur reductase)
MQTLELEHSEYQIKAGVISSVATLTAKEKMFEVVLPGGESLDYSPGQFVEVSLFGAGEAPISVCSSPTRKGSFELCVRSAGRLTDALHRLQPGEQIGIRGPFGVGFPIESLKGQDILLVAGGLGIAPLRSLINFIIDTRRDFGKVDILLGCRDRQSMLFCDELSYWEERVDINFLCSVDRADPDWVGNVGLITALIPGIHIQPRKTMAVVCGPPVMYRFVVGELLSKGIPEQQIFLSLERHMKCGLGRCGHCQIDGIYCCRDGPVLSYDRIKQIRGAI